MGKYKNQSVVLSFLAAALSACTAGKTLNTLPPQPEITYANYPGGAPGPAIPLRREKNSFTFVEDPEAAAFATERDVMAKAAKACGVDRIAYDRPGPELIFGTGQTADLIHARALLLWCRAYEPGTKPGTVLRVHFETTGDLILSITSKLEAADGSSLKTVLQTPGGFKMITVAYEAARDAMTLLSDKALSGDDVFDIWCRKASVNSSYWPSIWLRDFGEGPTYRLLGDTSKLYGGLSNADECALYHPNCAIRFTKGFSSTSLPVRWVGSAYAPNAFPRPGVEKSTLLSIGSYAQWLLDGGAPRLRHIVEYRTLTLGKPCSTRPVAQVNGLSNADTDAVLKGYPLSAIDTGWNEPDADCPIVRFAMGDHGLDGEGSYYIKLMPSKYGSVSTQVTYIFLLDGRAFMKANFSVDKDGHAGYGRGCETTILN